MLLLSLTFYRGKNLKFKSLDIKGYFYIRQLDSQILSFYKYNKSIWEQVAMCFVSDTATVYCSIHIFGFWALYDAALMGIEQIVDYPHQILKFPIANLDLALVCWENKGVSTVC